MTKNIFAAFLLLALTCGTAYAQNFWEEFETKGIDVEGVQIGQNMNHNQFVTKFGKPTKYQKDYLEDDENGNPYYGEYYRIGSDSFYFRNNGIFNEFVLKDSTFAALTLWIPGGIRVGDKLSKLDNFKYGKPKVAEWLKPWNGFVEYILFYNNLDDLVFLSVKDGIIHCISFSQSF